MFSCPNCQVSLTRDTGPVGYLWRCSSCKGRSLTVNVLKKVAPRRFVTELWQDARRGDHPRKRACPACMNRMAEIPLPADSREIHIDVCTVCHLIWFDSGEFRTLPLTPGTAPRPEPSPEKRARIQKARERLAKSLVGRAQREAQGRDWGAEPPNELWKFLPGILGMPVEHEESPLARWALATWIVTLVTVTVSLLCFMDLEKAVRTFGLIPAEAGRYWGATLVTSFFVHGGIMHLVGNMYFLLVFGDNVEDFLGWWRFLVLLLLATLVGDVAHMAGDPTSPIPCIGASGGISGVITYYALKFPRARLGILFRIGIYYWRWIRMPAWAMFFLWVLLQLLGVWLQLSGFSNVSALAHLGGATTGFLFWLMTRNAD